TFTPDGKALLGNSYYTGASNVFRLDIATGKYDVLTNASTGFFRPQLRPDGSLLVYDYTGDGFNPSIIQPQVRYDRKAAFGYYFHVADPLQFRQLSVSLAASPYGVHGGERFHANVEYQTPF